MPPSDGFREVVSHVALFLVSLVGEEDGYVVLRLSVASLGGGQEPDIGLRGHAKCTEGLKAAWHNDVTFLLLLLGTLAGRPSLGSPFALRKPQRGGVIKRVAVCKLQGSGVATVSNDAWHSRTGTRVARGESG